MSSERLDAYVESLQAEMVATDRQLDRVRRTADPSPEDRAEYMQLDIRKQAIEQRLRAGLAIQEERRLDALVDG